MLVRMQSNRNSHLLLVGMQNGTAILEYKTVCLFLTKLNIPLPYDPAIGLLGIYPNQLKTHIHKNNNKNLQQMLITALFITAQTWKRPRCTSRCEWINEPWYVQTMEYHLAVKRNELLSHEKTRRKLKCILLSEKSQSEKAAY